LQRCSAFWRQFCLHEFLTQALEGLLSSILGVLEEVPEGETAIEVVGKITDSTFAKYLEVATGVPCNTPAALLRALGNAEVPDEERWLKLRQRYPYRHPLSEWICEREANTSSELAARAILLLAILYGKWRGVITDASYRFVAEKAGTELAAPNVLPLLDSWLEPGSTWQKIMLSLTMLIVQQHDRVMYSKGRLESCWLHVEETRIVLDQLYTADFRSSRHEQAVQILMDLMLLAARTAEDRTTIKITERGRKVLRQAESAEK
jgi:hypothetical protein